MKKRKGTLSECERENELQMFSDGDPKLPLDLVFHVHQTLVVVVVVLFAGPQLGSCERHKIIGGQQRIASCSRRANGRQVRCCSS